MKKYRYGKQYFLLIIFNILFAFWLIFLLQKIIYTLILISIIIYAILSIIKDRKSYFTVSNEKLIWYKKNQKFEIYWEEVKHISALHSIGDKISGVCIYSDECNKLLVTWWFNNYRELIHITFEKCKNNKGIIIDNRVLKFIECKNIH